MKRNSIDLIPIKYPNFLDLKWASTSLVWDINVLWENYGCLAFSRWGVIKRGGSLWLWPGRVCLPSELLHWLSASWLPGHEKLFSARCVHHSIPALEPTDHGLKTWAKVNFFNLYILSVSQRWRKWQAQKRKFPNHKSQSFNLTKMPSIFYFSWYQLLAWLLE